MELIGESINAFSNVINGVARGIGGVIAIGMICATMLLVLDKATPEEIRYLITGRKSKY